MSIKLPQPEPTTTFDGIDILSFGIMRRRIPYWASIYFDVRFIAEPHWTIDPHSAEYKAKLLAEYTSLLNDYADTIYHQYQHSGPLTVAVGCAQGRHRSVAVAELLSDMIGGTNIRVRHLDASKK